jgi:hypothetical protein
MSQVLINQYLAELDRLKKIGGTHRESVVREAFKDLLKGCGRLHELQFIPEYKLDSATKDACFVDGALLHEQRVPFGYWEAKDAKDDLDEELAFKFKRGYPCGNRCAIDGVLDPYKEEKPKDPTIRARCDTYRFADRKEKVIDPLARVTTVSVETMRIVDAMHDAQH